MYPYLVFPACFKIEFHTSIRLAFDLSALYAAASARCVLPVFARRSGRVVSVFERVAVDLHGLRAFVQPCLYPAFFVGYVSFEYRRVFPFEYGFVPVGLEGFLGVEVLGKDKKSRCVTVEAVYYEHLTCVLGQHRVCGFLADVSCRHAQKTAWLLHYDQPLVFINDLQVLFASMSVVFAHTCCFRVQS